MQLATAVMSVAILAQQASLFVPWLQDMSRLRYHGSIEPLVAAIEELALENGKSFIRYSEAVQTHSAELDGDKLDDHKHTIRRIRMVTTLPIPNSTWSEVYDAVAPKVCPEWKLAGTKVSDWQSTMILCTMNLWSHWCSESKRRSKASWGLIDVWTFGAFTL